MALSKSKRAFFILSTLSMALTLMTICSRVQAVLKDLRCKSPEQWLKVTQDGTCDRELSASASKTVLLNKIGNNVCDHIEIASSFNLPTTQAERLGIYRRFYKKLSPNVPADCEGIVEGDKDIIRRTTEKYKGYRRAFERGLVYGKISRCSVYKQDFGYIEHPLTKEELEFPLAFGVLAYKDIEQVERLLRAIYRPHNYYCIHVDLVGAEDVNKTYAALKNISECFDNVIVPENRVDVIWGTISILQAEITCMEHLWRVSRWKYYINLAGQEFPLKTNLEVVKILKAMKGANIVYGSRTRAHQDLRNRWVHAGIPPHNIVPVIGSTHIAVNKDYVDFVLHDRRSKDFITWLENTGNAEETFFPSLNYNPHLGIPGSFLGEAEEYPLNPFFLRYKNWQRFNGVYIRECHGKFVRWICILGVGDISKAVKDVGLYANKFFYDYEPLGYDCLEEWLNERTWQQYIDDIPYDTRYYESLDQPRYQLKKGQENKILMW